MKLLTKMTLRLNRKLYRIHIKLIVVNFLVWLGISCVPLLISVVVSHIFDSLNGGREIPFYYLCGFLIALAFAQSLLIIAGGRFDTLMSFDIRQMIRKNMILNSFRQNKYDSGAVIELLTNDASYFDQLVTVEQDVLCKFIFAVVSFILLLRINLEITLFVLVPMFIVSNIIFRLGERVRRNHMEARGSSLGYSAFINDVIGCRETIQLVGEKGPILDKLEELSAQRKTLSLRQTLLSHTLDQFTQFSGILSVALTLLFAIGQMRSGHLTVGQLTLVISLTGYISQYNGLLTEMFCAFKYGENTIRRLGHVLGNGDEHGKTVNEMAQSAPDEPEEQAPNAGSGSHAHTLDVDIHSQKGRIQFQVRESELTVICGETGSGKSYVVDALTGYAPDSSAAVQPARVYAAYQEPKFLDETVEENVALSKATSCIHSKVSDALSAVNLAKELGDKMKANAKIGVNGKSLSEGQRQRLSIARALCHAGSGILLLDDSTSLIDYQNELDILDVLKRRKGMTILVSNRPNVLESADKIIVMKDGLIEDTGKWEVLKERNAVLRGLCNH